MAGIVAAVWITAAVQAGAEPAAALPPDAADSSIEVVVQEPAAGVTVETSAQTTSTANAERASSGLPDQIHIKWMEAFIALQSNNLKAANKHIFELNELRERAGLATLEAISLELIGRSRAALVRGEGELAAFLVRKALLLSPDSPQVIYRSLYLADVTRTASYSDQIGRLLPALIAHPHVLLEWINAMIYPVLWALTIGLYLAFVLFFCARIHTLLRSFTRILPTRLRGLLTPFVTVIVLSAPCLLGPLWVLAVWSIILFFMLPSKRTLGFIAGILMIMWSAGIYVTENLKGWFASPGIQTMLRVSSGSYHRGDREALIKLSMVRANDGVLYYTLGQLARRHENYAEAQHYFKKAEQELGEQPWISAQKGMIAFLQGDTAAAIDFYESAEEQGLSSTGFLVNYSKFKFDLLDAEGSRELFRRANAQDPVLAARLRDREDKLGIKSPHALAEIQIPFMTLLQSGISLPMPGVRARVIAVSRGLMSPVGLRGIAIMGIILITTFLTLRQRDNRSRLPSYYGKFQPDSALLSFIKIIPGGAWAVAGRPVRCFLLLFMCLLFFIPVLNWPRGSASWLEIVPQVSKYYYWIIAAVTLTIVYAGSLLAEEK